MSEEKFVKCLHGLDGKSFVMVREDTTLDDNSCTGERIFLIEAEVKHPDGEHYSRSRFRFAESSIKKLIPILQEAVKPRKFKKEE